VFPRLIGGVRLQRGTWLPLVAAIQCLAGCGSLFPSYSNHGDVSSDGLVWPMDLPDGFIPGSDYAGSDFDTDSQTGKPDTGCHSDCYRLACGDDGCGGSCGTCPKGTVCAFDGSQCVLEYVQIPYGGSCGPTQSCRAFFADSSWPACQDDQCREGPCVAGACSRWCKPRLDIVQNGTGVPLADGIEDEGIEPGDCAGAADGPFTGPWACVLSESSTTDGGAKGRCVPRSSFTPCYEDVPCPTGESCGYIEVLGNLEARCLAAPAGSGALSDQCGWDVRTGLAQGCSTWNCSIDGCTAPCSSDSVCVTEGAICNKATSRCSNGTGTCTIDADCSPWSCKAGVQIAEPRAAVAACAPRTCRADRDCRDQAFYCRHDPKLMKVALPGDPPGRCVLKTVGGAGQGEDCNMISGDGLPDVQCANQAYCLDGRCGALCDGADDCADGQRCGLREFPTDTSGDGRVDMLVQVQVCTTVGGLAAACTAQSDCLFGTCTPFVPVENVPLRVDLLCMDPPSGSAGIGSPCGVAAYGATCDTRSCLFEDAQNGVPGICSRPCRTRDDCPDSSASGARTVRWTCEALPFSSMGTALVADDLWVSWCFPVPGDSSLAPCDDVRSCADSREICRPTARFGAPGGLDDVGYFCVQPGEAKAPGHLCSPSLGGGECASGHCESTASEDVGFCSMTCATDEDCGLLAGFGATCAPRVVVPRISASDELVVPLCRQAWTCVSCWSDQDCALGMSCVDVSSVVYLSDFRCATSCKTDTDCAAAEPGSTCVEKSSPAVSSASGKAKACLPLACP
jgi:hypothetical protein